MKNIPTSRRVVELKRKKRTRRLRLGILFLVLIITIAGALAYFSFHKRVTINNVVVTGTSIINQFDIVSLVEKDLSGKYYYLYNRGNSLIYPRKEIFANLMVSFPRIKDLSVYRDDFNTLHVGVVERLGSYLYCGSVIPELESEVGENCYFVNNDGYIFDKAPYFSGSVYFKYYVKINDEENPLGRNIFEADLFHDLVRFSDGISELGFSPISLTVEDNNIYSLYLNSISEGVTPKVIFRTDNDLENILSNLSTAMDKPEFADEINSKYSTLQYIDLRFKNKVLYKFE